MDDCEFSCPRCGFVPVEGMREYLKIHGKKAKCPRCELSFVPMPAESEFRDKEGSHL